MDNKPNTVKSIIFKEANRKMIRGIPRRKELMQFIVFILIDFFKLSEKNESFD